MLIADAFHFDALNALRKRGVIATRPETLFGQDVAHALRDLLFMLANASAAANSDSARIEVLFGKLAAVEGAAGNLRGALFELIVGHCVRAIEGGEVEIGAVVVNAKRRTRAEIDVRLRREKVVKLCECKGYQPDSEVGLEEVEEWLTEKIPTIYGAMKEDDAFAPSGFEFEFWTCGSFGVDAMSRLLDAKAKTSKYKISWKDGAQIKEYAAGLASPGIKRILREHYFDDPVKVFGKSISEKKKRDRHGQLAAQMPSKESNDLRITDIDSYLPDGSSPF